MKTACLLFGVLVLISGQVDSDSVIEDNDESPACFDAFQNSLGRSKEWNETAVNAFRDDLEKIFRELEKMVGKFSSSVPPVKEINQWLDDVVRVANTSRIEPMVASLSKYALCMAHRYASSSATPFWDAD